MRLYLGRMRHDASTMPDRSEAAPYYFTYIDRVPAGDIVEHLRGQEAEVVAFARGISDARAGHRYAPGKWSIREVLGHVNDCERLFVSRAFWFARGFETPLPSFDQNVAIATAGRTRVRGESRRRVPPVRAASSLLRPAASRSEEPCGIAERQPVCGALLSRRRVALTRHVERYLSR